MSTPSSTPPSKRLKTDFEPIDTFTNLLQSNISPANDTILTVRDLSFQTPLRKKLTLQFTRTHILATTSGTESKVELSVELPRVIFVICTIAPDKTAKTYNFVILHSSSGQDQLEGVVFGVSDITAKAAIGSSSFQIQDDKSYRDLLIDAFTKFIPNAKGVIEPSVEDFSSPLPPPGRPKEKAFHITTYRGAKEGFLYLLNRGIFYGFRKGLLFWPLEDISEVTFQDVLARTFSLNIKRIGETGDGVEFSMIDQQCFEGVSAYVHRNGLQDTSLSEARRVQKTVNRKGEEDENDGELSRAVREYEEEFGEREEKRRLEEFEQAEKKWDESLPLDLLEKMDNNKGSFERGGQTEVDTSDDEELDATFERDTDDDDDGSATSDSSEDTSDDDETSEGEASDVGTDDRDGSENHFGEEEK